MMVNPVGTNLGPNNAGREIQMVIIGTGDKYGADLCVVNEPGKWSSGEPMVEFNDLTSWVDENGRGQFTGGRYNISTFNVTGGLVLDGANQDVWHLTPDQVKQAKSIINEKFPDFCQR